MFVLGGYDASMLFLFSVFVRFLSFCLGVSMDSSSRSGVNFVSSSSMFSIAPLYGMCCKISVQLGGIVPYLINGTVDNL